MYRKGEPVAKWFLFYDEKKKGNLYSVFPLFGYGFRFFWSVVGENWATWKTSFSLRLEDLKWLHCSCLLSPYNSLFFLSLLGRLCVRTFIIFFQRKKEKLGPVALSRMLLRASRAWETSQSLCCCCFFSVLLSTRWTCFNLPLREWPFRSVQLLLILSLFSRSLFLLFFMRVFLLDIVKKVGFPPCIIRPGKYVCSYWHHIDVWDTNRSISRHLP